MKDDLYNRAIELYGEENQKRQAIEEFAELIQEICKDLNGKLIHDRVSEEIADVEIMLDQLKLIYKNHIIVETMKLYKTERLEKRVTEREEHVRKVAERHQAEKQTHSARIGRCS